MEGVGSQTDAMRDVAERLLAVRRSLDEFGEASERRGTIRTGEAQTRSGAITSSELLQVDEAGTATTLSSSSPLAGPSTTFDGEALVLDGSSTGSLAVGGTYDGSNGKYAQFTFSITQGGEVGGDGGLIGGLFGGDNIEIAVHDDLGNLVETVTFDDAEANDTIALANGLELTVTEGEFDQGDTASLHVATGGGLIDPDQAFAGSGLGAAQVTTAFDGASTSQVTLGGTYAGIDDDSLSFEVHQGGTVGEDDIQIRVRDGSGQEVDLVTFSAAEGAGATKTLDNGLTISLGDGDLIDSDSFTQDVLADDQLVLAGGQRVAEGTFSINGIEIEVESTDTINSIAAKISASDAGVNAEFNSETQTFELTNKESGATAIELGDDSTGFLDAVGFTDAQATLGTEGFSSSAENVSDLEDVASGSIFVNGVEIAIDADSDSLEDVANRINESDAGAVATLEDGRLVLRATSDQLNLELDDGDTGFFDALGITTGSYAGTVETREVRQLVEEFARPDDVRSQASDFSEALNQLFADVELLSKELPGADSALKNAIRSLFEFEEGEEPDYLRSDFGIRFSFHSDASETLVVNDSALARNLEDPSAEFLDFLTSSKGRGGLVERLSTTIGQVLEDLTEKMDPEEFNGLIIDLPS